MNLKNSLLYVLCFVILAFFLNLGNYLDKAKQPIKSDIIVCLGGGKAGRILKSIELYNNNYSRKNLILLTGDNRTNNEKKSNYSDPRMKYINDNSIKKVNFIHNKNIKSTKEEIIFIKKFMIRNNYEKAIIVSDTPHTRRIQTLINILQEPKDKNLKFNIVSTNVKWWNNNTYYMTNKGQVFAIYELIKIIYTNIVYGFLDNFWFYTFLEDNFKDTFTPIKLKIDAFAQEWQKDTVY